MSRPVRSHSRLLLSKPVSGMPEERWHDWVRASVESARLAPSAVNRQSWSFEAQEDSVLVSIRTRGSEFKVSKRLNCGIAMLHIEVAAGACGCTGRWEFIQTPQVARLRTSSRDASTNSDGPQ